MSYTWLLKSIILTVFILQISSSSAFDGKQTDPHRAQYFLKSILSETNNNDQLVLLNQLRHYLNTMCLEGYFGSSQASACQHIAELSQQLNPIDEHDIQKRFFCNGFIGCKNAGR